MLRQIALYIITFSFFLLSFSSSLDCQKLDFWVKDKKLKIT